MKNLSLFSFKEFISTNEQKSVVVEIAQFEDLVHLKEYEQRLNNIKSFAKVNNSSYKIFVINNKNTKINEKTTKWMRKLFSEHGRHIIFHEDITDEIGILDNLYKKGYKHLSSFDSDLYESLLAYNGKQRKDKRYFLFESTKQFKLKKVYNVEGTTKSTLFEHLESNDFPRFKDKMPKGIRFMDIKNFYLFLREQYGFPMIEEIRSDAFLKPTPIREQFIKGKLFSVNDIVTNKNDPSQIQYTVTKLGSNYLVVSDRQGNDITTKKMWIEEAKKVNA